MDQNPPSSPTPPAPPQQAPPSSAVPQPGDTAPQPPSATPITPPEKTSTVMTVVTILLLIFFPLFGIISMWVWTQWSKKLKWILTIVLLVLPFLAIFAAISLIAANPSKQFSQADNTKRRSDATQILSGLGGYAANNKGTLPVGITSEEKEIAKNGVDLCTALVPQYLPALPADPSLSAKNTNIVNCDSQYTTGYTVSLANGVLTVSAPHAELNQPISMTRPFTTN